MAHTDMREGKIPKMHDSRSLAEKLQCKSREKNQSSRKQTVIPYQTVKYVENILLKFETVKTLITDTAPI